MNQRLRALCDLAVATAREYVGRHEYDGVVQDLSPEGVRAGLARLGGPPEPDPHDEAHLATFEAQARLELGELELYRSNPLYHLGELDLSCYEREYAPAEQRAEARRRHLAAWPDAGRRGGAPPRRWSPSCPPPPPPPGGCWRRRGRPPPRRSPSPPAAAWS